MGKFIGQLKKGDGFNNIFEDRNKLKEIKQDNNIFFNFNSDFSNSIIFVDNPEHKLDSDKWFQVDYTKCSKDIIESIDNYYQVLNDIGDMADLNKNNLSNLDFLIYGKKIKNNWDINLQTITSRYFIKSKSYIQFMNSSVDGALEYKTEQNALEFQNIVNIYISQKDKKIYFKRLSDLRKINDNFVDLYKEASSEDVITFITEINTNGLFEITTDVEVESTNLKKLKFLIDDGKIDEFLKKDKKIKRYINKYKISLFKNEDKYIVKNNADVTSLMKIFYENFYQGEITGNLQESNSSIKMK
jgi:hypothetical protein